MGWLFLNINHIINNHYNNITWPITVILYHGYGRIMVFTKQS